MSRRSLSILSVSNFEGKKLLVIMAIVVVTLTVDSQIGIISDFIPEQLASNVGIAVFIGIWTIFAVTQYYILCHEKQQREQS
jgi:hypothetical protein